MSLLQAGPPFDPAETVLSAHDAFLLDDVPDSQNPCACSASPSRSSAAWRELMTGNVRLAEHVYTWTRSTSG
jgi:hypothetical protein